MIKYEDMLEIGVEPWDIMTMMEDEYHIPFLNNEKYNAEHPEVIALYRKVSDSRFKPSN